MPNTSGGSVVWDLDVDSKKLSDGLKSAESEVSKTARNIDSEISSLSGSIASSFKNAETASFRFAGGLAAIGAAGLAAGGFGVSIAAEIETARQGFVTLLGSAELADQALAQIKKDALETPFEFTGLVRANQLLTQVTKNAPRSEKLLLNVGKALAAAGKGSEELDNVIVNLQQIANTSKISELDIRQFGFAGINILELLATHYGTTKDAAGDMVKNSSDAFADLEAAFAKAGEGSGQFSRAFIDQAGTFKQLRSNFGDTIGQLAGDIVVSTGIFEAVKNALASIIEVLIRFTPQIIGGIKGLIEFVKANGPVIVGVILGGLAPAFVALASAIAATVVTLAPFIAAGAVIGFVVNEIVKSLGGWVAVQTMLQNALVQLAEIFNTFIKPALDEFWRIIQTELIPELQELWQLLSPILIPALKALAALFVGVVVVSLRVVIEVLKVVVQWVATTVARFNDLLNFFQSIPERIRNAFAGVSDAITKPFNDARAKVEQIAQKIKEAADRISPFHRESPSLVDNVTQGIDIIKNEFKQLSGIQLPSVAHSFEPQEANTSSASRGDVRVTIGQVNNAADIDMLSREIGFRTALATS